MAGDALNALVELSAWNHYLSLTTLTSESDVKSQAYDSPFTASAGMFFTEPYGISDMYFGGHAWDYSLRKNWWHLHLFTDARSLASKTILLNLRAQLKEIAGTSWC